MPNNILPSNKKLLTVKELADLLVCHEPVVHALVQSMHPQTSLPCVEAGGGMYFDPEAVYQWFEVTKEVVKQAVPKS
jgi:hypothetical protein